MIRTQFYHSDFEERYTRNTIDQHKHMLSIRGGGCCQSKESKREAQLRYIMELEAESKAMRDSNLDLAYQIVLRGGKQ